MRAIFFVLFLGICSSSADVLDFLEPKKLNRTPTVGVFTSEEELLTKPLSVVFVTDTQHAPEADTLSQLTVNRSVPVSVFVAPTGALKDVKEGKIVVYREGRRSSYYGFKDATVILKYISLLENAGIKTISNRIDKVAFERTRRTRLVGYFAEGSNELTVFEESAKLFGSQVAFFVVTDPVVAKHLKLNTTGQIYLTREFDKTAIICPQNPASLADIQRFIVQNRESFIRVTPMNAKDPSLTTNPSILLITDSSPLSHHILKLVARILRDLTLEPQLVNAPRMLWIDADDFPVLDVASQPIHGLKKLPGVGFCDPADGRYEWLDLSLLIAAPADRVQEDLNMIILRTFISSCFPASTPPTDSAAEAAKTEL